MYHVVVVGSTGAVGREILSVLEKREFPIKKLTLLASERSAGKELFFKGENVTVENIETFDLKQVDFAFFSAGSEVSEKWAPKFAEAGAVVIDNTSFFRMESVVPLIVPEINGHKIKRMKKGIIANPNCSTIQMVLSLKRIDELYGLKKVVVSTYQSVSGSGQKGMSELEKELVSPVKKADKIYPREIAFNVIPQIDDFTHNGFTKEEMKMVNETKKIMNKKNLQVNATCVRVPVMRGHSETVYVETKKKIDFEELFETWGKTPNLAICQNQEDFATPKEAEGLYETYVGRVRKDLDSERAMSYWVVSDNLLKGAALNSVQIAEEIVTHRRKK